MSICLISPVFFPAVGGTPTYLRDIAKFCCKFSKTFVVTSKIKGSIGLFEKYQIIKSRYGKLSPNIEIIRANTLNNPILKTVNYFNEYLNNRVEIFFNKFINPIDSTNCVKKINNRLIENLITQKFLNNPNFLQLYFILKRINQKYSINIIHSAPIYLTSTNYAYKFSKKKKIPFIITPLYHLNPYAKYIFYPSYQAILKNANEIIALTQIEKNFYIKFGIREKKIHVIPPGINPDYYNNPDVKTFKENYKIRDRVPILLFMGRRTYEKGILQSIHSLKYLINKYRDIILIIIGPMTKFYNSIYKDLPSELKKHILDLGVVDNDTKLNAIANCDVFLMPSLADSFGIAYLEAWLCKKPVIGALEGNVAGVIDDNKNGYLIPFKSSKILSMKIDDLLENEKKRMEFGINGYNKVLNQYNLEITNNLIFEIYKKYL